MLLPTLWYNFKQNNTGHKASLLQYTVQTSFCSHSCQSRCNTGLKAEVNNPDKNALRHLFRILLATQILVFIKLTTGLF